MFIKYLTFLQPRVGLTMLDYDFFFVFSFDISFALQRFSSTFVGSF